MHLSIRTSRLLTATIAVVCFWFSPVQAKKPDNPGGGDGGSGSEYQYSILTFAPFDLASIRTHVDGLNDNGTAVVGDAQLPGGEMRAAYLDIATGTYTTFADGAALADVNNLNQIVGAVDVNGETGAFWAGPTAEPVLLPPLDGHVLSRGRSVNDDGIIVGTSWAADYASETGAVWRVARDALGGIEIDGPRPLPFLPGDVEGRANSVTELESRTAQVVGTSVGSLHVEAALWTIEIDADGRLLQPTAPQPLGSLHLKSPSSSRGAGINNDGDAVGYSDNHPYLKPAGANMQLLPETSKTVFGGRAWDVNGSGEIVGNLRLQDPFDDLGVEHAMLWKDGEVIDLHSLVGRKSGWTRLWDATEISNTGVIAGLGDFDGERGYIMLPYTLATASLESVPEPSAGLLFVFSCASLVAMNRTRFRIDVERGEATPGW